MRTPLRRNMRGRAVTAVVAALVILGLTAFALLAAPEKHSTGAAGQRVLAVKTVEAVSAPGYDVIREFVGRVEARRESQVGFERGGMVAEIRVDEGDFVKAGAVLATLDTQILVARRSELIAARNRARAESELAGSTLQRTRTIRARNAKALSAQALDDAEKNFAASKAALQQAEAAIRSVDVQLEKSVLLAPYDALVAGRLVDEGQVIAAGTPILFLLESAMPEVRIGVGGGAVDQLREGGDYELTVRDRRVPAVLRSIVPLRNRGTRSVDVIFNLQVPFDGIRRGDLARFESMRRVDTPGFWLPLSALTESSRGLWAVYVAAEGDGGRRVLERRELEILYTEADRVFARGSLSAGEQVVAGGLHRLVPGQTVTLAEAEPLPDGGGKERSS